MSKKKEINIEDFKNEYLELKPRLEDFLESLKKEIEKIISEAKINLAFPIQTRTKTWESICEKHDRVSLGLKKITDMQDLCGMRIILLFSRDSKTVIDKIEKQLNVVKSYDTGQRLGSDQFGYVSTHIIAQIPNEWLKVPTLKEFDGYKIEIQIRTISQHLWAEASNTLQYKKAESVPSKVLRSVSRVSALLETVDLEFERVLSEKESYRQDAHKEIKKGEDTPLNVDILEQILDDKLPVNNKDIKEPYILINRELYKANIKTKNSLIDFIEKNLEYALEKDRFQVESRLAWVNGKSRMSNKTSARISKGVYFTHLGLIRQMLDKHKVSKQKTSDEKTNKHQSEN